MSYMIPLKFLALASDGTIQMVYLSVPEKDAAYTTAELRAKEARQIAAALAPYLDEELRPPDEYTGWQPEYEGVS